MATASATADRFASLASSQHVPITTDPSVMGAKALLDTTNSVLPFHNARTILDAGCGSGTLTTQLLDNPAYQLQKGQDIIAFDNSPGQIGRFRTTKQTRLEAGDERWKQVTVDVGDAQNINSVADDSISHAVAGMVLFMVPDPVKALKELDRVLESGGVLGFTSWVDNDWMRLFVEVCAAIAPKEVEAVRTQQLPDTWRSIKGVRSLVEDSGLTLVKGEQFACNMGYENAETIVNFLGNMVPGFREMLEAAAKAKNDDTERTKQDLIGQVVEKLKEKYGVGPAEMKGTVLVVIARKP